MVYQKILFITVLTGCILVLNILEVKGQNSNQVIQNLRTRIESVETANRNYQVQINQLQTRLENQITKEKEDFYLVTRTTNRLQNEVSLLSGQGNFAAIKSLQSELALANAEIDKLEDINKIWRSNFQVVNRTFTELRRKHKMVISNIQTPVFVVRAG